MERLQQENINLESDRENVISKLEERNNEISSLHEVQLCTVYKICCLSGLCESRGAIADAMRERLRYPDSGKRVRIALNFL